MRGLVEDWGRRDLFLTQNVLYALHIVSPRGLVSLEGSCGSRGNWWRPCLLWVGLAGEGPTLLSLVSTILGQIHDFRSPPALLPLFLLLLRHDWKIGGLQTIHVLPILRENNLLLSGAYRIVLGQVLDHESLIRLPPLSLHVQSAHFHIRNDRRGEWRRRRWTCREQNPLLLPLLAVFRLGSDDSQSPSESGKRWISAAEQALEQGLISLLSFPFPVNYLHVCFCFFELLFRLF